MMDTIGRLASQAGRKVRRFPAAFARALVNALRNIGVALISWPVLLSGGGTRITDLLATAGSMLRMVLKRLRHNLGLTVSALVGVMAVLGMVICVPIFSHTVSGEILRQQLEEKALSTNRFLFSMHMYYVDKRSASRLNLEEIRTVTQMIRSQTQAQMGLPVDQMIIRVQTAAVALRPQRPMGDVGPDEAWISMSFISQENVPELATLVEGEWPKEASPGSGPIQVAVLQETADQSFLNVGDRFSVGDQEVEIAGIWQAKDPLDKRWFDLPTTAFSSAMWVPTGTYFNRLGTLLERPVFYISWYFSFDDARVQFTRAPQYARGIVRMTNELSRVLPTITADHSPLEALEAYQGRAESMTTLFYAVGGPMVVLALLFISLTATIAVQQYEQETATMRGRGTSWWQVVSLNLLESVLLVLIAFLPALVIGWLAAGAIHQTLSFLKFTNRGAIPFSLQGINFLWLLIAALLIILARFMPNLGISRTTIVKLKQEQSRSLKKPIWQRFYLDFLLLIPGIYAYVTMSGLAKPLKFLSNLEADGGTQYRDALLFVAPALFAMALCMIAQRVLPLLTRLLAWAFDKTPGVWAYLSIQQIARRPQDHASALLLIMISLSLAIFSASTAKTLDQWLHDSQYYKSGADLVVHEYVVTGGDVVMGAGDIQRGAVTLSDLDVNVINYVSMEEHLKLPSVEHATRVGKYPGTFSYGAGEIDAYFMGIDRLDFPQVAFVRDDFGDQPMGALMNALAADPNAVLIPKEMGVKSGLRIGDHLLASIRILDQRIERDLIIVGTYDYFPTIYPADDPTLVLNLESLFDNPEAVIGYDVWLDLRPNTDVELLIYQLRQMMGSDKAVVRVVGDALREVRASMDQPERVGLFGVLNVGFLATGLMPGIGFVLYSYASLRRRFIQLGILQAVGLSTRQLIGYLALEQSILMGLAIFSGALIGLLTSHLFVPFLQVGATPGKPIPPFEVLIGWGESAWLSLAFAFVLFLTTLGTIAYLARIKVFQAVKMGETL